MELLATLFEKVSRIKALLICLACLIAADIGLAIGKQNGIYDAIVKEDFAAKTWFFMALGCLIFWLFNYLAARPFRLIINYLFCKLFNAWGADRDYEYYSQDELIRDAIKSNNQIAEKLYYESVEKSNNLKESKDIILSILIFLFINCHYDYSLMSIIPWEESKWAKMLIAVIFASFVYVVVSSDTEHTSILLPKKIRKNGSLRIGDEENLIG